MGVRTIAVSLIAVLIAGCEVGSGRFGTSDPGAEVAARERPPDLVVVAGDDELSLDPYTYCWSSDNQGVCADGEPPDPLPALTVDGSESLAFRYPLDWNLQVRLFAGGICDGGTTFENVLARRPLDELGPAGTYRVEVFGRGAEGDGAWAFELTSTEDRPHPSQFVQVFWHPSDRALDEAAPFGVQLGNLTTRPTDASAVATVTSADHRSTDLELRRDPDGGCWASTVGFTGPNDMTARVLQLGSAPYEVTIDFSIDGSPVTSPTFTWPTDFPANSDESGHKPLDSN